MPVKRTFVPYEYGTYPNSSHFIKWTVQFNFTAHLNANHKLFMIVYFRGGHSTLQEISLFKAAQAVQSLLTF